MTPKKKGPRQHKHVWGSAIWSNGVRWIFQCWVCEEYGYGVAA